MTNKDLYREFGNIDPAMVEAAAPSQKLKNKKRNTWTKWISIAACFCLIITATIIVIPYMNSNDSGTQSPDKSYAVSINGFLYEPISLPETFYEKYPELENVTEKITTGHKYRISAEDLGEYIGIVPALDEAKLPEGKAYHWLAYPNLDSIIIVEREGKYSFYVSDGYIFSSESINSSSSILEKYNLPDSALNLEVLDSEVIITDKAEIADICEIISNKEHDAELSYRNRIWEAWQSEKGDVGVSFDGTDFSYSNPQIHEEFAHYFGENIKTIIVNTENGFEITLRVDLKYNYFLLNNKTFNLSQEEVEQLSNLLN